jgi:hypothetical protein
MTQQEKIERFEEKCGMRIDPDAIALEQLRAWQKSQGIEYAEDAELPASIREQMEKDAEDERLGLFLGPGGQKLRRGQGSELKGDVLRD